MESISFNRGSHLTLQNKYRTSVSETLKVTEPFEFQPVRIQGQRPWGGYQGINGNNELGPKDPNYKAVPLVPLTGQELPEPQDSFEVKRRISLKPKISNITPYECKHYKIESNNLEFGTVQSNVNGWKSLKKSEPHGYDMECNGVTLRSHKNDVYDSEIQNVDLKEAETSAYGHEAVVSEKTGEAEMLKKGRDTIPNKRPKQTSGNSGRSGYARGGWGANR